MSAHFGKMNNIRRTQLPHGVVCYHPAKPCRRLKCKMKK